MANIESPTAIGEIMDLAEKWARTPFVLATCTRSRYRRQTVPAGNGAGKLYNAALFSVSLPDETTALKEIRHAGLAKRLMIRTIGMSAFSETNWGISESQLCQRILHGQRATRWAHQKKKLSPMTTRRHIC